MTGGPLKPGFGLSGEVEIVEYAYGRFDDVRNPINVETGRHYSVVEFKVAAIWHFGRRAGK